MSLTGRLPVGAGVGMGVEGVRKAESQRGQSRSDMLETGLDLGKVIPWQHQLHK